MIYSSEYLSPLGKIILSGDENELYGLWFDGQKHFPEKLPDKKELKIFIKAKKWLDIYFSGCKPEFDIPVKLNGTEFQNEVWEILCTIPYGETMTYGDIAKIIAERRGIKRMSAQAVGGAVGRNKISIIVPCHRVIGSDGGLTGYDGGIDRKFSLLELEK